MKERKPYIDIIRAFSVCLIVLYHFCGPVKYMGDRTLLCMFANGDWGNVGVFLFFMISGNCLIYHYQDSFPVKEFYKKRFLRIMIPFWALYALTFLSYFWSRKFFPPLPLYKMLYTLIGMDGYLSYRTSTFYILGEWFLGCIILLYLLFPLTRLCVRKNIHITLGVLFILNIILYLNNFWGFFQIPIEWNLLVALFYFVFGAWLEQMIMKIKNRRLRFALLPLFLACGVITVIIPLPISRFIGALIVCTCLYVLFMHAGKLMEYKIISVPVTVLSRNSYLIFLVHHVIINRVASRFTEKNLSLKEMLCVLLICAIFIAVAVIIYHGLEQLCTRLIHAASPDKKR